MKPRAAVSSIAITRITSDYPNEAFDDVLAVEEPLEIRLGFRQNGKLTHRAISITMRTPGNDEDLAAGFLFTEGIIRHSGQIAGIRYCGPPKRDARFSERAKNNTIRVDLADGIEIDLKKLERHFYTTSSCGVCGKSSIAALHTGAKRLPTGGVTVSRDLIHGLPDTLRAKQKVFDRTGGLHASAIFNSDGTLDIVREDVGRHNALDKVIGYKFITGELPMSDKVLLVSGRASFELVQKALMAGIPVLAAVGAPSSLAVELAQEFGMTLIGFVRDGKFNIYCGEELIAPQAETRPVGRTF